ncbi:MAG: SGNH/GDSL hydrolase family protein [bacterium]|nr:SGNH/GDSL hydrolase family protein [bacterium]
MPRPEIPYEKTWIFRLKKKFPEYDFIEKSARGSTSMRLVTEGGGGVDLLETYRPETVILQLGMVECAPRLFRKKGPEFFFINKILPARLRPKYIRYIKKKRVRNPELTDVSPEQFKANITAYFTRAAALKTRVIVILILTPTTLFKAKSPHIEKNITLYNDIYKEAASPFPSVEIIPPFDEDINMDDITLDELHINEQGYDLLYQRLKPYF